MSVITPLFGGSPQVSFTRAHRTTATTATTAYGSSTSSSNRDEMIGIRDALTDLIDSLNDVSRLLGAGRASIVNRAATVSSSADTGLSTQGTATTLSSDEEVNSTATSFSPRGPTWDNASTSELTIGGVYDGSQGDTQLRIRVDRPSGNSVVGQDSFRVRIYDGGDNLETFWVDASYNPGEEITTGTGLTLSFGEGYVRRGADAYVDVYTSQDSELDPDAAFDGVRNAHPELEEGYSITDGSFDVNGETIAVNSSDSLNDVLDRINASDAGVTATYDAITEQVTLTNDENGSETITLANYTSGFLAAMKLDTATPELGSDNEAASVMSSVAEFAGVTAGSILINGTSIDIDPDADSLNDVIDRINASDAGVTALLSVDAQTVTLTNDSVTADLVIDSNGTGLFEALNIDDSQEYEPVSPRGTTETTAESVSDAIATFAEAFNALFDDEGSDSLGDSAFLSDLRGDIQLAVADVFGSDGPRFSTNYGVSFNFAESASEAFGYNLNSQTRTEDLLRTGGTGADIYELFLGGSSSVDDGLQETLVSVLEGAREDLNTLLGPAGTFLDIWL